MIFIDANDNEIDIPALWSILSDEVVRIRKSNAEGADWVIAELKDGTVECTKLLKIDWHDKKEICRPNV